MKKLTIASILITAFVLVVFMINTKNVSSKESTEISENKGENTEVNRPLKLSQNNDVNPEISVSQSSQSPKHEAPKPFKHKFLSDLEKFHSVFDSLVEEEEFSKAGDLLTDYSHIEMESAGSYSNLSFRPHLNLIDEFVNENPRLLESSELINAIFHLSLQLNDKDRLEDTYKRVKQIGMDKYGCYEFLYTYITDDDPEKTQVLSFKCAEDPNDGKTHFLDYLFYLQRNGKKDRAKEEYFLYREKFGRIDYVEKIIKEMKNEK